MKNTTRFPSNVVYNADGPVVHNAKNYIVVNPEKDYSAKENNIAFFGNDALIKHLADQAEMSFMYSLICHDPVENEDMLLLESDDRSHVLRIMNRRRNIDGDFYAYHIEVRSETNVSEELRRTDDAARLSVPVEGVPVAVDCSDDLPF